MLGIVRVRAHSNNCSFFRFACRDVAKVNPVLLSYRRRTRLSLVTGSLRPLRSKTNLNDLIQ